MNFTQKLVKDFVSFGLVIFCPMFYYIPKLKIPARNREILLRSLVRRKRQDE
jgi:hypothetical protein